MHPDQRNWHFRKSGRLSKKMRCSTMSDLCRCYRGVCPYNLFPFPTSNNSLRIRRYIDTKMKLYIHVLNALQHYTDSIHTDLNIYLNRNQRNTFLHIRRYIEFRLQCCMFRLNSEYCTDYSGMGSSCICLNLKSTHSCLHIRMSIHLRFFQCRCRFLRYGCTDYICTGFHSTKNRPRRSERSCCRI